MLKKVVSVHPVSARLGTGGQEAMGEDRGHGRPSGARSMQGRGWGCPTVRLAGTARRGRRGAGTRRHLG